VTRLRRLAGDQAGHTLPELLIAMSLMLVVLSATLLTLNAMERQSRGAAERNDAQAQVRQATSTLARELRNTAAPSTGSVSASVELAEDDDVVIRAVNPQGPNAGANSYNVRRVRYCLGPGSPTSLIVQTQSWTDASPPALPSTASCPDPAWGPGRAVAGHIVNRASGRGAFRYDEAMAGRVSYVHTDLEVDPDATRPPAATRLQTGVHLRNQNRPPTPAFTATPAGSLRVILNGSLSADPEGEPLVYVWRDGEDMIGEGIVCDCQARASGTRQLSLAVIDSARNEVRSAATAVVVG
jgi:prepilin-type N-terminal cleavage/methylation domain-containing protein